MPKQQSQLEKARSRAETLTKFAIKQHNRRARDLKSQRVKTEKKAEEMVARQEERYRNYIKAQQINANSGGGMAGAMQGGMTGASLGGMFRPWGALAGGLLGAAGGGLYGASEGRQAVAELAPYAAGISQVAGGISQMQANKERTAALGQMYGGGGFGRQPAGYGAPKWGAGPDFQTGLQYGPQTAGGVSLTGGQGLAAPFQQTSARTDMGVTPSGSFGPAYPQASYNAYGNVGGIQKSPYMNYYMDMLGKLPDTNR